MSQKQPIQRDTSLFPHEQQKPVAPMMHKPCHVCGALRSSLGINRPGQKTVWFCRDHYGAGEQFLKSA